MATILTRGAALPYARLIDPVTALFAVITGQSGLPFRFHHLRHSFANWIFITFLAMDEPELLARRLPLLDSHLLAAERLQLLHECFFPLGDGAGRASRTVGTSIRLLR